ncbi:MAG: hypothetical protein O3A59_12860, partial [Nitrospirae bacterium]|nr:hypothetical protein [Nitrospirota bacterium]
MSRGHSPEHIAGRLRREYHADMQKRLSAATIYVGLYVGPRGALRSALLAALRQARNTRRPRSRGTDRGCNINCVTGYYDGSIQEGGLMTRAKT